MDRYIYYRVPTDQALVLQQGVQGLQQRVFDLNLVKRWFGC